MTLVPDDPQQRAACAVLASVQLPGVSDEELQASLDELERLAQTLGLQVSGRVTQRRPGTGAAVVFGAGKLKELARLTGGTGRVPPGAARRQKGAQPAGDPDADAEEALAPEQLAEADLADPARDGELAAPELATTVLFDHDLSPSQLRNLEAATGAAVLDRSSVILSIFQRHARTREARLQVEIARLRYLAPRLREARGGGDRQQGGIGGKGAGESALELDRRRVRDRLAALREQLADLQRDAGARRARREKLHTVALVGYTNAGKSSLMRALTGSDVLVEDQLFATLDTATRTLQPPSQPRVLVSDTVGFIKKLPHDLVASFYSTLEEARCAALLLHVVDCADPAWRAQLQVTREVLETIGAGQNPSLVVLNKADRLADQARRELTAELPQAQLLSALDPAQVAGLRERILAFFEREMIEAELFVSYRQGRLVHAIYQACRVLDEVHEEAGTRLRVRAPGPLLEELRQQLGAAPGHAPKTPPAGGSRLAS